MASDVELADQDDDRNEAEDARSLFSQRERVRQFNSFSNRDARSNPPADIRSFSTHQSQYYFLDLFRLLRYYKIQIFSLEPDQRWNIRPELGRGAEFAVDEANLSISSTLSHLQYRNLDFKGPEEASNFVDHTGTSWSRDVPVAFKSAGNDRNGLSELITELQVLSHPPLQQHPHIVRLLGLVLVLEQNSRDLQPSSVDRTVEEWAPQEIPMLVVEKAPHASLRDFLTSDEFQRIPSSLKAKLSICIDVLNALQV